MHFQVIWGPGKLKGSWSCVNVNADIVQLSRDIFSSEVGTSFRFPQQVTPLSVKLCIETMSSWAPKHCIVLLHQLCCTAPQLLMQGIAQLLHTALWIELLFQWSTLLMCCPATLLRLCATLFTRSQYTALCQCSDNLSNFRFFLLSASDYALVQHIWTDGNK